MKKKPNKKTSISTILKKLKRTKTSKHLDAGFYKTISILDKRD